MNVKHKRWTYVCDAYMDVYAWDKYMYERMKRSMVMLWMYEKYMKDKCTWKLCNVCMWYDYVKYMYAYKYMTYIVI